MPIQSGLLEWFSKNQRPLPWRKKYEPYEVWVSEIMLQQTQVETALPYFERWMKSFPTIASLAKAAEKKVLKAWEGLGYYSRARNLHATAGLIMKEHGGKFPDDFETIRSLKGVGPYTAGAIASIAFNQDRPIVDGNILRVLSRVYAIDKPIDDPKNQEIFWRLEEKLIPKGRARFFNQALMELGALICVKNNPACLACPIHKSCKAFKQNKVDAYPVRSKRKKIVKIEASALVLEKDGKYLIQKRPVGKIMGGLWEFPEWKLSRNQKLSINEIRQETLKCVKKDLALSLKEPKHLGSIKRNYTHHSETLHVFLTENLIVSRRVAPKGSPLSPAVRTSVTGEDERVPQATGPVAEAGSVESWPTVWVPKKEFRHYPFSSAHAKIAALLD
ncbi:MAG: A/G-specific adenine glycosylase [Candidatus Omnitrophota bacterium]